MKKKRLLLALAVLTGMFLLTTSIVWAEDQVLTIYFCGTTLKEDANEIDYAFFGFEVRKTPWFEKELIASLYHDADNSDGMEQTNPNDPDFNGRWYPDIEPDSGPYHKYIVNGAGTSPDVIVFDLLNFLATVDPDIFWGVLRSWDKMKDEALNALELVNENHPGDKVILNLVGFSRGGITALIVARAASEKDYVKKINILAYDPVPGCDDPIKKFGNDFVLSSKVNQYVGVYADHERSFMFEPILPKKDSEDTKILMVRVPGSHETMVGNRQVFGHATLLPDLITTSDLKHVNEIAATIAEQLLSSYEWGKVPFDASYTDISTASSRGAFSVLVDKANDYDYYDAMTAKSFTVFFGYFDTIHDVICDKVRVPYFGLIPPNRMCFKAGERHATDYYPLLPPFPFVYKNFNRVYLLKDEVDKVSASTWDDLQDLRGDVTPPVPDLAELPDIEGQCSASITSPPTATDDTDGVVTGTTTDLLTHSEQGTYQVTWTYSDESGNTSTQTQYIVVKDTEPPSPAEDELATIEGQCSAEITVNPTAIDNCVGEVTGTTTDPLSYTEQGTYLVTWTYDDGNGNTTTQMQTVVVQDTIPPVIENLTVTPDVLWPSNHKMVQVNVDIDSFDECDIEHVCQIISVENNEPENGLGDGNKAPDWQIADDFTVNLRSERSGPGNGRLYTITIECTDASGNSSTETVAVTVTHDKGKKKALIKANRKGDILGYDGQVNDKDDGVGDLYDSNPDCGGCGMPACEQ
jgi:hypothetical protein